MISTILRSLGILDDTIAVVVVPVSVWRRMHERLRKAEARVALLEKQLADMEQGK